MLYGFLYLLTLVTLLVQARIDYQNANLPPLNYLLCGSNLLLCLHLLFHYSREYAATMGAFYWNWYAWVGAIKVMVFSLMRGFNSEITFPPTEKVFLPLPYALFMLRAYHQLFGDADLAHNVQYFLYFDTVLAVLFDLYDSLLITEAATTAIQNDLSRNASLGERVIPYLAMLFGALIWFFHATAFPRAGASAIRGEDITLCRKSATLTSIILCDVPFLVIRVGIWFYYPLYPGLQGLVIKNVVCVPLWFLRYRQCRKIEAQGNSAEIYSQPTMRRTITTISDSTSSLEYDAADGSPRADKKAWWPNRMRNISVMLGLYQFNISTATPAGTQSKLPELIAPPLRLGSSRRRASVRAGSRHGKARSIADGLTAYVQGHREIPVRSFEARAVFNQVRTALVNGACASWLQRLSADIPVGTRWQRIRLVIPVLVANLVGIAVFLVFPDGLLRSKGANYSTGDVEAPLGYLGVIIFVTDVVCYFRLAPMRDILYSAIVHASDLIYLHCYCGIVVNCLPLIIDQSSRHSADGFQTPFSVWLLQVGGSKSPTEVQVGFAGIRFKLIQLILVLPAIRMGLRVLHWLWTDICVLAGVTHVRLNKPPQKDDPLLRALSASLREAKPNLTGPADHFSPMMEKQLNTRAEIREMPALTENDWLAFQSSEEDQGILPMSALLLFRACISYHAPLAFHKRLMMGGGGDVIKCVRLNEYSIHRRKARLLYRFIIIALAAYLLQSAPTYGVAASWVGLQVSYYLLSQAIQLIAIRGSELQRLMVNTAKRYNSLAREEPDPDFILLSDVDYNFRYLGLFTSPGPLS